MGNSGSATRINNAISFGTKVQFVGNPKRGSSGDRWSKYSLCDNLRDALDSDKGGATRSDINWDLAHNKLIIHDGLENADAANFTADAATAISGSGTNLRKWFADPTVEESMTAALESSPNIITVAASSDDDLHDAYYAAANASSGADLNKMETAYMVDSYAASESAYQSTSDHGLPTTDSYKQALDWKSQGINHGEKWCEAFEKEVDSFKRFNTFETIRRDKVPTGSTIISGKFTGKIKTDSQGKPVKWKQRFVIRGFLERFGEHFFNTQTQTLNTDSAFTILALAAGNRWRMRLIDLTAAYQHGSTDTDKTYVQMPPGFEEYDEDGQEMVYHLTGNMYGTRSAGRIFARFRDNVFFELGMTRFAHDRCCFYRKSGDDFLFISAFVDDLLCVSNSDDYLDQFYRELTEKVEATTDPVDKFLGMTVTRDDASGSIALDNRVTIDKLLSRFGWENLAGTKDMPLPSGFDPSSNLAKPDPDFEHYVFLGFISYLAATTRLDLKAPLNALARYTTKWNSLCTLACKHLARYLVKSRTIGLKWQANNSLSNKVIAFSDFGSHQADHSMGGYVIMLNGAAISSRAFSIKQVVTSTGAGEARALFECAAQMTHVLDLVKEFGFCQEGISNPIFCDSQTVLASVLGDKKLKRSKQYAIYINYVKEKVQLGIVHLRYCESSLQCADIMTKGTFPNTQHFLSLRNMAMGQVERDVSVMEKTGKIISISETVVDKFGRPIYKRNGIKRSYDDQDPPSSAPTSIEMAEHKIASTVDAHDTSLEMAEYCNAVSLPLNTSDSMCPITGTIGVTLHSTTDQESNKAE